MEERARYSIRRGAVELTARQWLGAAAVLVVGLAVAAVMFVMVSWAAGSIALSLTSLTLAGILIFGRRPDSPGRKGPQR
jgi:hypothetical protein